LGSYKASAVVVLDKWSNGSTWIAVDSMMGGHSKMDSYVSDVFSKFSLVNISNNEIVKGPDRRRKKLSNTDLSC
jgi:hypothetical protein